MVERNKASKAIILSRVSSKEQEEGYSIDAQKFRLQEYCIRKGLEILKTFEFSESSTTGHREKFNEAINFAKEQKEIIAVVSDKVDRLQRSYKETPLLNDLIAREKIELHFYTENCIIHKYSTSQEKMTWNMFVMMAQSYVDSLRDNINRSIAQKLREGEWISKAPIGYAHIRAERKVGRSKGKIVVDEDRAPLIKRLFEEYSTGAHTLGELVKKTKEWGLYNVAGNRGQLSLSHIHRLIQNPFYYGVMRVQRTGKEYPHIYQPIITKELFDRCQRVRLGWKNKPFKWYGKEYIFRGLIKCGATGRVVTSDTKRKTYANGKTGEWTYLRVWNPDNPKKAMFVKEEKILKKVEKVFKSMHLESAELAKAISHIKTSSDAERSFHKNQIKELHSAHTKTKSRLDRLTDLFLDGDIDKVSYEEKRKQLIQKRADIVREIENHNRTDDKRANYLIHTIELASRASEVFKGSTTSEKRKLINLVLSNLELKDQKLSYTLHSPFDQFIKTAKTREWRPLRESNPCLHRERVAS